MESNSNGRTFLSISLISCLLALLTACGGGVSETTKSDHAPTTGADALVLDEDAAATITPKVTANDSDQDGDPLALIGFSKPRNGTLVDNGDGTFTYTPNADFSGTDSFTYIINDGRGGIATGTVSITVAAGNDAPVAADDTLVVDEDTADAPGNVLTNDTDPDGDTLTVALETGPSNGAVVLNADGTFTYTPDANFDQDDSFTYTVDDGNGGTSTATVAILINPLNDAPVAVDDSVTANRRTGVVISDVVANDTDADGNALSVITWTQGDTGTVSYNGNGSFTYLPSFFSVASDSFTYTIVDNHAASATGTVNVSIDRNWSLPYRVGSQRNAAQPKYIVDSTGVVTVLWIEYDGVRNALWSRRLVPGSGWTTPGKVDRDIFGTELGNSDSPMVITDVNGNVTVVWRQWDVVNGRSDLWANTYDMATGEWGIATKIEDDDNSPNAPEVMTIDGSGAVTVIWAQYNGSRNVLYANRLTAGGSWQTATSIDSAAGQSSYYPKAVVDFDGNIIVVWRQWDGTRYNLWANRYDAVSLAWSTPEVIETGSNSVNSPELAIDANGVATAAWTQSNGTRNVLYTNRYMPGGSGWQGEQQIDKGTFGADTLSHSNNPQLVVDANRNVTVVWYQYDSTNSRYDIWANRYEGAWATAVKIDEADGNAFNPRLAVDNSGVVTVAWDQSDGARNSIVTNRFVSGATPDAGWQAVSTVDDGTQGNSNSPKLSVDDAGNVYVIWKQNTLQNVSLGIRDLFANRYDAGSGSWGMPVKIDSDEGDSVGSFFDISMSPDGTPIVVWERQDVLEGGFFTTESNAMVFIADYR